MRDVFVPVSENISGFFVKKLRTVLWRFAIWIGSWFSGAGIVTVLRVVGGWLASDEASPVGRCRYGSA
jgi:hypothetical protein